MAIARLVHRGSEWRSFADDANRSDPNRTGGPENVLLNNDGMSTSIQQTGNRAAIHSQKSFFFFLLAQ